MMRKTKLLIAALLFVSSGLWAAGGSQLRWNENMRSVEFPSKQIVIHNFNGSKNVYALDDVRSLVFVEESQFTGIVQPALVVSNDDVRFYITAYELRVESPVVMQSLALFSVDGKILATETRQDTSLQLNISSLPKGIYLLRIKTAAGISVKKFIKQ